MEQESRAIAEGVAGSSDLATAEVTLKPSANCSRFERHLMQALQRADALSPTSSNLDFSIPAVGPGVCGDGLSLVTPPSNPPSIDPALTLSHSSESDQVASTMPCESGGSPNDGTAAAVQQRALRAREKEVVHLRRTIQELSSQLNCVLTTLDQRADTSAELETLKKTCEEEAVQHEKGMRCARLEMLESRVKYRTMEEHLAATYEADVHARATELLEPHTKEVHDKNFELLKEKIMLTQEVSMVRAEYKDLRDTYVRLKRQTDLDGGASREMLQRSVSQKDQIASLRQLVKTTEDNLNAVVAEYEEKLLTDSKTQQAVIQSLTRERDAARRDALQLRHELQQLRSAAGNVLAQRSELETFFYAALEEVRVGVVEERRQLLLENTPAARITNARQVPPAHTMSSLLRLEGPERLLLTDGANPALLTSSPSTSWTVERKSFPKRIAAVSLRNAQPAARVAAASSTSSARRFASPLLPTRSQHDAAVSTSADQGGWRRTAVDVDSAFRLGTKTAQESHGASSPAAREEHGGLDTAEEVSFPLLKSLPSAPAWRDAKRVDIKDLCWVDKERVIQLLFKRIRQEGQRQAILSQRAALLKDSFVEKAETVAAVEGLSCDTKEISRSSLTFLTQQ
ncbi:hypothetical protein NXY56_008198 [Leishmania guyanensis]|uniref:Uncharacterized protein n=1 Tax=Leishmania guyanensis TaxID=5670 RepID=A0A1E1J8C8_LEIGU|nr:hypothetical protein, conserved [Leishmania guyanensis]